MLKGLLVLSFWPYRVGFVVKKLESCLGVVKEDGKACQAEIVKIGGESIEDFRKSVEKL